MSPLFALFIVVILIVVIVIVVKADSKPKTNDQPALVQRISNLMNNDVLVRDQTFLNGVPTFVY